jgi:hypothetical protein
MRRHEDEDGLFAMEAGCATHGEAFLDVCARCGAEFCRRCSGDSPLCPDCAAEQEVDESDDLGDIPGKSRMTDPDPDEDDIPEDVREELEEDERGF